MPIFRKKPVEVEAVQNLAEPTAQQQQQIEEFLAANTGDWESGYDGEILIHTKEGDMTASPGDWIIKGTAGELYPCKPNIFAEIYEPVSIGRTEPSGGANA
jgi:hypothetical protein